MKDTRSQKNNGIRNNQSGMLGITFVACILLVVLFFESQSLNKRLTNYRMREEELIAAIEDEHARAEEIDALKEYMKTDAFAEEVAREKLGLVKDNEIVFIEEE